MFTASTRRGSGLILVQSTLSLAWVSARCNTSLASLRANNALDSLDLVFSNGCVVQNLLKLSEQIAASTIVGLAMICIKLLKL